jgi:phage gp45-like
MRGYFPQVTRAEFVTTNDGAGEQTVDVFGMAGEKFTKVYRPQTHGLAGHAPAKSNGILIALGGERSKAMLIGGETPGKRPTGIAEGNTVLYDAHGNVIYLKGADGLQIQAKDGHVYVSPGSGKKVYLGGDPSGGGTFAAVATQSGYSTVVFAKV